MTMSKRMRLSVGWVPGQVAELCRVAPLKTHSRWMKVQRMFAPWYRPPLSPPRILASVMRRLGTEDGGPHTLINKYYILKRVWESSAHERCGPAS